MLLAGGAVALIGIAYLMTAGGSEDTGGTSGGGGLLMPGQGVSMAPVPVSDGGAAPMTYTLSLPENPVAPAMMAVPAPHIPTIPAGYDTSRGGDAATKKDSVVSGVPVSAPSGGTVYAYGVSGVSEAKAAQSAALASGAPNVNVGREIAPGVTMVDSASSTTTSKKDSNVASAAGVGFGAGLAASPLGGLASAIGGLFGW